MAVYGDKPGILVTHYAVGLVVEIYPPGYGLATEIAGLNPQPGASSHIH
jgi:hypothetical protein